VKLQKDYNTVTRMTKVLQKKNSPRTTLVSMDIHRREINVYCLHPCKTA